MTNVFIVRAAAGAANGTLQVSEAASMGPPLIRGQSRRELTEETDATASFSVRSGRLTI
jgi:hypothetical protein